MGTGGTMDYEVSACPNPATTQPTVSGTEKCQSVEPVNILGRPVVCQKIDGDAVEIDVGALGRRICFLRIHAPYGVALKKVVPQ